MAMVGTVSTVGLAGGGVGGGVGGGGVGGGVVPLAEHAGVLVEEQVRSLLTKGAVPHLTVF